mgnify:CR=1 FL=1
MNLILSSTIFVCFLMMNLFILYIREEDNQLHIYDKTVVAIFIFLLSTIAFSFDIVLNIDIFNIIGLVIYIIGIILIGLIITEYFKMINNK